MGKFLRLCNNCAKDVEVLRMALYKPAQVRQGIVTGQGAENSLLLKPSCLACGTTACCAVGIGQLGACAAQLGVSDLFLPPVFSKLS